MKLGLFGGSFDPFHSGHLEVVRAAQAATGVERMIVLPTAAPPHKLERELAAPLARYAMSELALLDEPGIEVSSFELTLGRPAYTIDTLEYFARLEPAVELVLVVGSDSLAGLATWRRWPAILDLAELAVVTRPGAERERFEAASDPELRSRLERARLRWVVSAPHPASATEIRRRLAAGESVPEGWLDPRVLKFATKYRLYR